jgi:hypothetical protein
MLINVLYGIVLLYSLGCYTTGLWSPDVITYSTVFKIGYCWHRTQPERRLTYRPARIDNISKTGTRKGCIESQTGKQLVGLLCKFC